MTQFGDTNNYYTQIPQIFGIKHCDTVTGNRIGMKICYLANNHYDYLINHFLSVVK